MKHSNSSKKIFGIIRILILPLVPVTLFLIFWGNPLRKNSISSLSSVPREERAPETQKWSAFAEDSIEERLEQAREKEMARVKAARSLDEYMTTMEAALMEFSVSAYHDLPAALEKLRSDRKHSENLEKTLSIFSLESSCFFHRDKESLNIEIPKAEPAAAPTESSKENHAIRESLLKARSYSYYFAAPIKVLKGVIPPKGFLARLAQKGIVLILPVLDGPLPIGDAISTTLILYDILGEYFKPSHSFKNKFNRIHIYLNNQVIDFHSQMLEARNEILSQMLQEIECPRNEVMRMF